MSRTEDVIAEALAPHWRTDRSESSDVGYERWVTCRCGWASERSGNRINSPDLHHIWNGHTTTVVIEAIRNLSPDDLAELIRGEVESEPLHPRFYGPGWLKGRAVGPAFTWQETP